MKKLLPSVLCFLILAAANQAAQEVDIIDATVDESGRIQIQVASSAEYYYTLFSKHDPQSATEFAVSITRGEDGTTFLTESLAAYPPEHYRVLQHRTDDPVDEDSDGIDDIDELQNLGPLSPLNPAEEIDFRDGTVCIPDRTTFEQLSYQGTDVLIDEHLSDLEYVKFYILDANTDNPGVYFMNTVTHRSHGSFARAIGISRNGPGQMRGEIIYHPSVAAPNGKLGVYRFEFEPNDNYPFAEVQMAYEALAANMHLLQNNLMYYPMPNAALPRYRNEKELYDQSRVHILLEEDLFSEVDYIPLNLTEGYGLLRVMELDERPSSRDVVLYEALPNEMPRVGGIITTVPQTPLSHVNLRAIQDNVPNAFIRHALADANLTALIGKYVYYKVGEFNYEIREATLEEVDDHFDDIRPDGPQTPLRDLSVTGITRLDDISFDQWTSFGVKAANVATMRTFNFPEGTIPDGFGVPFYFYDEFMKFNGFYAEVEALLANPDFLNQFEVQDSLLSEFRETIRDGDMPQWMLDALADMQNSFPEGTSIRCRSSTNNEDLPGFSGAGLYTSKTQHPDEGHISKSIKQVYAGLWNFRAFNERDFYRIDHFVTAMGVLVHPNYSNEKANGVAVTTDPIYFTESTFYLNTQLGEDLVTNPEALSIPEEILLDKVFTTGTGYSVIRPSNLVPEGTLLLEEQHITQLRSHLNVIDEKFRVLYDVKPDDEFAMEIEYKITEDNRLAIKQARPWVFAGNNGQITSYAERDNTRGSANFRMQQNFPNPFSASTTFSFEVFKPATVALRIFDVMGNKAVVFINQFLPAGMHTVTWDAALFSSGTYFAELSVNGSSSVITVQISR